MEKYNWVSFPFLFTPKPTITTYGYRQKLKWILAQAYSMIIRLFICVPLDRYVFKLNKVLQNRTKAKSLSEHSHHTNYFLPFKAIEIMIWITLFCRINTLTLTLLGKETVFWEVVIGMWECCAVLTHNLIQVYNMLLQLVWWRISRDQIWSILISLLDMV